MAINPKGYQCWHVDAQGNLDCEEQRQYQCSHCAYLMCERHTRKHNVEGHPREYCVTCYTALFLAGANGRLP